MASTSTTLPNSQAAIEQRIRTGCFVFVLLAQALVALFPFIIADWAANFVPVLSLVILPMVQK